MEFKKWLAEVGMGGGGVGGGMAPPLQKPETSALADYQGAEHKNAVNQNGKLPPAKKRMKK